MYTFADADFRVALAKWLSAHSYRETAKSCGLTTTNVFEIASGKHPPRLAHFLVLCGLMNVDPSKFITHSQNPNV